MTNEIDGIIQILNKMGYNIVWIDKTYYIFDIFNYAQNNIEQHIINGRNVTKLISEKSISVNLQTFDTHSQMIRSEIEKLPIVKREYHKSYKWILFERS